MWLRGWNEITSLAKGSRGQGVYLPLASVTCLLLLLPSLVLPSSIKHCQ